MIRLIVALALACSCGTALAQKKMYRCGNQFQERPCAGPNADTAVSPAAKVELQERRENAERRREREQAIHQAKCADYADELADIDRRIKAGADEEVMDQFRRRHKEMRARIDRTCK